MSVRSSNKSYLAKYRGTRVRRIRCVYTRTSEEPPKWQKLPTFWLKQRRVWRCHDLRTPNGSLFQALTKEYWGFEDALPSLIITIKIVAEFIKSNRYKKYRFAIKKKTNILSYYVPITRTYIHRDSNLGARVFFLPTYYYVFPSFNFKYIRCMIVIVCL